MDNAKSRTRRTSDLNILETAAPKLRGLAVTAWSAFDPEGWYRFGPGRLVYRLFSFPLGIPNRARRASGVMVLD